MWGYAKFFLYSMGDVSLYNIGKHLGVGVRYVDASISIYVGEIMRTLTHNLSYILWECVTN